MTSFETFGQMLSYLRERERLTQRELARAVGYSDAQISRLEKDQRRPDPTVVAARFVEALHLQGEPELAARLIELARQASSRQTPADGSDGREPARSRTPRPRPHSLPAPTTTLIGREADVAAVLEMLRRDGVRLVTLLGPPGVGKTRLALQTAWEARESFLDGAWFVPLAGVDDVRLIAGSIVQALELPNSNVPPLVILKQHLRDRQHLLVLDNLEQLLSEPHASNAAGLIAELLTSAPGLKVLATSRAALRMCGEHLFEVPQLSTSSAVSLFAARAQAILPAFTIKEENARIIAEICARLDHLPLAIELAAARVSMFEPAHLLARLSKRLDLLTDGARDLPPRQRTLRSTIEWSYNLLSPEEQTLFRRLGVFAGGCSLEAAERVAGEGLHTPVDDLVQSLTDKSMIKLKVQDNETRCLILETIREYALTELAASGEGENLSRRHADYFAEYAESVEAKLSSTDQLTGLRRLERDVGSLQMALAYARSHDDIQLLVRYVSALWPWLRRIHEPEGWTWLPALLDRPNRHLTKLMRVKVLLASARLLIEGIGDWTRARLMLEESMQLSEELGATQLLARSRFDLGQLCWSQGEYAKATDYCEQGATLIRQSGDSLAVADSLNWQAAIARDRGDCDRAAQLFEQSLQRFHEINDSFNQGMVVNGMGDLAFMRGDYDEAQQCYEQARLLWSEVEVLTALTHRGLGRIAYVKGDLALADSLLDAGVTMARKWMNATVLQWNLHHYGFTKYLSGDVASAMALLREGITVQHRMLHRLCLAESLERFAWAAADMSQPERAARLFGAADALRTWMGAPLPLGDKPLYDRFLAMTRAALDSAGFEQAWAEGAAMSLDAAVEYALAVDPT